MSENESRGNSKLKAKKSRGKREREVESICYQEGDRLAIEKQLRYTLYLKEKEDKEKEKKIVG
jgi:hypothetical protein